MRFIIKINLSYNQLYYIMEMVQRPWCTAESFAMRLNNIKMNEYYSLTTRKESGIVVLSGGINHAHSEESG